MSISVNTGCSPQPQSSTQPQGVSRVTAQRPDHPPPPPADGGFGRAVASALQELGAGSDAADAKAAGALGDFLDELMDSMQSQETEGTSGSDELEARFTRLLDEAESDDEVVLLSREK